MHEWALAEAVASTAEKAANKEKIKQISKIKIKVGELQQLDTEIFEFALREISQPNRALLKKAKIDIEIEKGVLKCRVCGCEWDFDSAKKDLNHEDSESIHFVPELSHTFIKCPQCKSPDFEVIKGRRIWIESLVGIKE
jgi:hydrogenase nickel incorporation protein HypA/HybF